MVSKDYSNMGTSLFFYKITIESIEERPSNFKHSHKTEKKITPYFSK